MKTKERRRIRRQRDKDNTYYRHVDNDHSLIITTNKTNDTIQTHVITHIFHSTFNTNFLNISSISTVNTI